MVVQMKIVENRFNSFAEGIGLRLWKMTLLIVQGVSLFFFFLKTEATDIYIHITVLDIPLFLDTVLVPTCRINTFQ